MLARIALLQTLLQAGIAYASSTPEYGSGPSQTIKWGQCDLKGSMPLTCGNVTVPLDYTEPDSGETLKIELVRASHTKKPFMGSILMNFGGPGGSGSLQMAENAEVIHALTGGHHDIIGFDQRGTGKTLLFSCFKNAAQTGKFAPWMTEFGNSSDVALGRIWATSDIISETCYENAKDVGSLIGSAFTARDLMQIVDALDEDGMLRFWGFSYGTALGQTVASMFPDRMDKVIMDGVLNPYEWWNWHDVQMYADTDDVFKGFVNGCAAAPDNCALTRDHKTADEIEAAIYDLMERLKYHPMTYNKYLVDWSFIRVFFLAGLYGPSGWPLWAEILDGLMQGNTSVLDQLPSFEGSSTGDRRFGIVCSDKTTRGKAEALTAVKEVMEMSKIAGDFATQFIMQCAQWKMDAKERYEGNFNTKTKNPVLLIGNTYDPVTPLRSAHNMSSTLVDSVVVEQQGYGHCSLAQPSKCTNDIVQAYLMNGTMPEPGTKCKVDSELFEFLT